MRLKLEVHRLRTPEDNVSMAVMPIFLHFATKSLQDCHEFVGFPLIPSMSRRPVRQRITHDLRGRPSVIMAVTMKMPVGQTVLMPRMRITGNSMIVAGMVVIFSVSVHRFEAGPFHPVFPPMSGLFGGQRECSPRVQSIGHIHVAAVITQLRFAAKLPDGLQMKLSLSRIIKVDGLRCLQAIGHGWKFCRRQR